ncbi:MAG: alginate lyase family protein [Gammaproteobacteria bacterium]
MQTFSWYLNRFRQMSIGEMAYRLRQTALGHVQARRAAANATIPSIDYPHKQLDWLTGFVEVEADRYVHAADRIVAGRISVFAVEDAMLGATPSWNKDVRSGVEAPLIFGKKLDYRDPRLVGDIKYLWEPNRHLELVTLAQAYRLTGSEEYLHSLREKLESWFEQCPHLLGPNWASSLELGIRLINWAMVWQLIGGAESAIFAGDRGVAFKERWLTSVYQHARFISGYLSRFSSANNHLVGEVTGLFVACCVWPLWKDMQVWRARSYAILTQEALRQNCPDGVNREQAIAYQHFVLDFLLIAALVGKAAGAEFPREYWGRVERMLVFLASLMDVAGNVPMIGDADDGYVVRLSQERDFCHFRSLLATGAILFERADFKLKAGHLDDKTKWLLGGKASAYHGLGTPAPRSPQQRAFPEGGYYILGTDFDTKDEIRLVVDAGPLGYQSIAAHGHADALAFTLSVGGSEFLIDPGTYAYHTNQKWRNYFRGTAAHNTVRVDNGDQSVSGGNFMWIRHARAWCEEWSAGEQADVFRGAHDGYTRLSDPVLHRREIRLDKPNRRIEINDTMVCKRAHIIERPWHFSEHCTVRETDDGVVVTNAGETITLKCSDRDVTALRFSGDAERPAGWVSRRYDVKIPTTTLVWLKEIDGETTLRAVIDCSRPRRVTMSAKSVNSKRTERV